MRRERNTKRKRGSGENKPRVSKISTPEKNTNKRKLTDKKESTLTSRRRKRPEKKEANAATRRRRRSEKNDSNRNTTRRRRQDIHTSHSSNRLLMVVLSVVVVAVTALGLQFAFSSQSNIVRLEDQDHRDNQGTPLIAENNDTSQQQQSSDDTQNIDNAPRKIPQKSFYDNPKRNTQHNPVPYTPPRIQPQQKQTATPEENTQEDKSSDDLTPAENVLAEIDDSTEQQSDHREQYVQKMQEQGFVTFNGLWVQEKALDYHKSIAQRWQKGDVLIDGFWHEQPHLGEWYILVANGENYEGFLQQRDKYYHFMDIKGQKRKFALDNVKYKKEKQSPFQAYFERLKRAKQDSRAHFALAMWCRENSLTHFAEQQLQRTIFLAPDHQQAREELGYTKYKGTWLSEEEIKNHPDMVNLDGQWISKEEAKNRGYTYSDGQWIKKRLASLEKREEQRSSEVFLNKVYCGKHEQLGSDKVKITYDFSDQKYTKLLQERLKEINSTPVQIRDGLLDLDQMCYFPVVFQGNLRLTFTARISPGYEENIWIRIYNDENKLGVDGYSFVFAFSEFSDSPKTNVIHFGDGDRNRLIQRKSKPKIVPGQWYRFDIVVSDSYLSGYVNGKRTLHKKHTTFRSGMVGFGTYQSRVQFKQIVATGTPEPRWLQKITKSIQAVMRLEAQQRDEALGKNLTQEDIERTEMLASHPNSNMLRYINSAVRLLNNRQYQLAIEEFGRAINLDRNFPLAYLERGYAYMAIDDTEQALADINKAISLKPTYAEAYVARGSVHRNKNDFPQAIENFEKAISINKQYFRAYQSLARLHIGNNDTVEVEKIITRVRDLTPQSGEAKRLIQSLNTAVHGPNWVDKYEKQTTHYHVMTNVSQSFCNEMAARLELVFREYSKIFAAKNLQAKKKSRVLIFDSVTEFNEYSYITVGDTKESAAGYYSTVTKELVLYDDYDKTETIDTLYHEGFHQFLDLIVDDVPFWFNEGMATYFGKSKVVRGKLQIGIIEPFYVLQLRSRLRSRYTPYNKLLLYSPKQFMEQGRALQHYDQSWAIIHFLIHGDNGQHRNLLGKYLGALKENKSLQQAFDIAFGGIDFAALEGRLITYFAEMDDD